MHDVCDSSPFSRIRFGATGLSLALLGAAFATGCSKPVSLPNDPIGHVSSETASHHTHF